MNSTEQKKVFAQNLSNYTNLCNKTQSEIAKAIGSLPSAYTSWMQGVSLPRMDKIQALADFFNVSITDLLDEHTNVPNYSEQNATLANMLRKDSELSDAVMKLTQLSDEDKKQIYGLINLLYGKQTD